MEPVEEEVTAVKMINVGLKASRTVESEKIVWKKSKPAFRKSNQNFDNYSTMVNYVPPKPVNGRSEFEDYLRKNMTVPVNNDIDKSEIVMNFLIQLNGRPDSIIIVKSPKISREIVRLLKSGPDWLPATLNGEKKIEGTQLKICPNP